MAGPIYYEGQRAENPNDPNAPVLIYRGGKWVPESAVQNPFAAAQTSQKYADTMATGRAKRDEAKLAAASEAACLILSIDETVKNPKSEAPGNVPMRGAGARGRGR